MADSQGNEAIVEGFNSTITLAVSALEARARDVESVAGDSEETAVVRAYAAARFFINQVDVDMRVHLRTMASDPSARVTAEKLLALTLKEAVDGVRIVVNALQRTARSQLGRFGGFIDADELTVAQASYKTAVAVMVDDHGFMGTLAKIRNEVAAHMFSDETGIESSAAWVVSRSVMPKDDDAMYQSLIFSNALLTLRALHDLDAALVSARKQ